VVLTGLLLPLPVQKQTTKRHAVPHNTEMLDAQKKYKNWDSSGYRVPQVR
jgi:hypothetical protein